MKKIVLKVFITICILLTVINIPIIQVGHQESQIDYSNWMGENIEQDISLSEMSMLGAHDAFSRDITFLSEIDPYTSDIFKGPVGYILKGYLVRQAVTQTASPTTLLQQGVRYLDVRLTYKDETWYTKHNYISEEFSAIAEELVSFIEEHEGEIVILDFQHINGINYAQTEDYELFLSMLKEYGLFEHAYYSTDILGETTYFTVSNDKTESKFIIIDKFEVDSKVTYQYQESIRSEWANEDDFDDVIQFLKEESVFLEGNSDYDNHLKVMQAVTTMQMSGDGVIKSLQSWSLIERAEGFNVYLLESEDFDAIFNQLPIVMVDYSDSNSGEYNDNIMHKIIEKYQN